MTLVAFVCDDVSVYVIGDVCFFLFCHMITIRVIWMGQESC